MPTNNFFHRNVFINFKEPVYAKGKSMGWHKTALGFSEYNVILTDDEVLTACTTLVLPEVLVDLGDALEPIPVGLIGVEPSSYINTQRSPLGVREAVDVISN